MITVKNMKNRKIKFTISEWQNVKATSGSLVLVDNEFDENYKLIKSELVEELIQIFFNNNNEVEAWKNKALKLKDKFQGKELRTKDILCIVWSPKYENIIVKEFKKL